MCVPCNYTQSENNLFLSIIISTSQDITLATFGQLQAFNPDTDSVTTYELLRNLVSPSPPESLKLSELTDILKQHYEPKPLVIEERFHFHRRFQTADELIAEFMAQLRRLSKHCDFKEYLEQALRDRLVCGLRNEGIQRRLLARALEIAQGMELEAAERNAKALKGSEAAVHKMKIKILQRVTVVDVETASRTVSKLCVRTINHE